MTITTNMTATVTLTGVTKAYGKFNAISDASCVLNAGENIALVGHNGAGKTTMIKLMLGLIRPTCGTVQVLGEDPAAGQFAARRKLGYLPEHVAFNMALTGRETLTFYARLKAVGLKEIAPLLDHVGLSHAADRRIGTYSKGMRQRLGLAQALLGKPSVLLLDEPTTGLDPALRQNFYDLLETMRADGTTILMSSHALTELENRVGRVIIANRGKIIADGSIDELRHIARLPVRIRVSLSERDTAPITANQSIQIHWQQTGLNAFETDVPPDGKITLLQSIIAQNHNIADLDVIAPSLDELYAHFLTGNEAAQ